MHRFILPFLFTISLFACVALAEAPIGCDSSTGITVFVAKKIITMDPGWPSATAVAVQNGRIVSVGTLEQLKPWVGEHPKICDFKDDILMPGFVEPHQHPLNGGILASLPYIGYEPMRTRLDLQEGYNSKKEVFQRLKELSGAMKNQTMPLLAWGYDELPQGNITRGEVNGITDRPLALWSASEHVVYANDAWLRLANIPPSESRWKAVGPTSIESALSPPRNSLNSNTAPKDRVNCARPDTIQNGLEFVASLNHFHGVTTMSDLDFGGIDYHLEYLTEYPYFNRPDIPMRLVIVTDGLVAKQESPADPVAFVRGLSFTNTEKVAFHGVKFFFDDAFLNRQSL